MAKFTMTHDIKCDVEKFWQLFFDAAFNDALFKKELGFPSYKVLEERDSERELFRKVSGEPKMEVPGPIAKVLGDKFAYTEEGRLEKPAKVWRWPMIPSVKADKIKQNGVMRVEAAGPGKCRRTAEITMEANITFIGGMIESMGEKQLREGWDKSAQFFNRWIKEHP